MHLAKSTTSLHGYTALQPEICLKWDGSGIDFELNFAYIKAMKEKVPGVLREGPRKAGVTSIFHSTVSMCKYRI